MAKPFLTGSRVYGTPHQKSDVDLVVLLTREERDILDTLADEGHSGGPGTTSLRFGVLNLLIVEDEEQLAIWRRGTEELKAMKDRVGPVTRDQATSLLDSLRYPKPTKE